MTKHSTLNLAVRPRRKRSAPFIRSLCRETTIGPHDLILPVFVHDSKECESIKSMPGVMRHSSTSLLQLAETCLNLGIPAIAVFPVIAAKFKSLGAEEAFRPEGLVPTTIRSIKQRFPELGVISDIALDPYTLHGQDGILDSSGTCVLNDETITVLVKQALCHAEAGADMVAPSDMMDGRIGAIRQALEQAHYVNTLILSYAAKYASSFYGPFRDAVGSAGALGHSDKKTYQMDPSNIKEAKLEAQLDADEGADIIMVKPGMMYLDVIHTLCSQVNLPIFAYQVSGEYAMLKAAAQQGWLAERDCVLECLMAFKRAGCSAVLSYYAMEAAAWMKKDA